MSKRWTAGDTASVSREGGRIADALEQWSTSRGWSQNRDAFDRSVSTSSRSDVSTNASGISSNITEAQSFSREARRFYEEANRIETRWSARDGEGVSGSLNTSDAFLAFARAEMASTPLVYRDFDPANASHWHSSDPQVTSERDMLMSKYVDHVGANMRTEIEGRLAAPDANGLSRPATSRREDVRASGEMTAQLRPIKRPTDDPALTDRADDVRREVTDAQYRGAHIVDQQRRAQDVDTAGAASGPTKQGAAHTREWGRSAPRFPLKRK